VVGSLTFSFLVCDLTAHHHLAAPAPRRAIKQGTYISDAKR